MVNGINWNPFTNRALSQEEIQYIDEKYGNKDGVAQQSEIEKARSWLAGKDLDGKVEMDSTDDVKDVDGKTVYEKAKTDGSFLGIEMKDVKTDAQFDAAFEVLVDTFIEEFAKANSEMTPEMKAAMKQTIQSSKAEFLKEKNIKKDEKYKIDGKYNMELIADEFGKYINDKLEKDFDKNKILQGQLDSKTENLDAKYNTLMSDASGLGDEISAQNWVNIRTEALDYILGMLLAAETSDAQNEQLNDFLKNMGVNGVNGNSDLKKAKSYCDKIKTETNPDKIKEYMDLATQCILKFLNTQGKDKVVGAAKKSANDNNTKAIESKLNSIADQWVDDLIKSETSDLRKEQIRSVSKNAVKSFIEEFVSKGVYSANNVTSMVALELAFKPYLTQQLDKFDEAQSKIKDYYTGKLEFNYDLMVKDSDRISKTGNIGEKEKAELVKDAATYILSELLSNNQSIELLEHLGVRSSDLNKVKQLVKDILQCSDPQKMDELLEQAMTELSAILNKFTGQNLVDAINKTKPMEITNSMSDSALVDSDIYEAYTSGVTRDSDHYGKQSADRREEIEKYARDDLKTYAESVKKQMQAEMGENFSEELFNQLVESAINDTIKLFWDNFSKIDSDSNYKLAEGTVGFKFGDKSGGSGRYMYRVDVLVNKFKANFNEAAKALKREQRNPESVTFDFEDVLANAGLVDEYGSKAKFEIREDKEDGKSTVLAKARATLMAIKAGMKSSMLAKGCMIPSSQIDKILEDSFVEMMKDPEKTFLETERKDPGGVWSVSVGLRHNKLYYFFDYNKLINGYKDKVYAKIEDYWNKNKEDKNDKT